MSDQKVCGYIGKHNIAMILVHLVVFFALIFILFILFVKTVGLR